MIQSFKNINLRRTIYIVGGMFIAYQGIVESNYWLPVFALYFVMQGIIGWGCAANKCVNITKK